MVIDKEIQQEMFHYYNERAKEHDLVYLGEGPALQRYADEYKKDVARISEVASSFGSGHLIDIACGTGFWAPFYARNCSSITFADQSEKVLLECRKRIEKVDAKAEIHFVQENLFDFDLQAHSYDCALIGFLLSHFTINEEGVLFGKLKKILKPGARIMVIDSAWSKKRRRHVSKSGIENRRLEDGRVFRVYKKYFEQSEIEEMLGKYHFTIKNRYVGDMLFTVVAESAV